MRPRSLNTAPTQWLNENAPKMFFVCSLSNSIIITITRIESTRLTNAHTHILRVVHKTRNRLSVTESQSNNLALVNVQRKNIAATDFVKVPIYTVYNIFLMINALLKLLFVLSVFLNEFWEYIFIMN